MEGQTLSHYKVLEKLGGGGMGVVYKALDTHLDRHVALKLLPLELTRDDDARERFVLEAKAASALDHPNICTIYDIDETPDGQMFIAMGYYDGETLKKRIERGPLPVEQALDVAMQVAQGLAEAHAADIVHRDVKPANVMLTKNGLVKIVDFGIAKLLGVTGPTQTGTTLGAVSYMSPEQPGRRSAITTDELTDGRYSAWSPDGSQVAYTSTRSGTSEVWLQPADGSGEPQQLTQFDRGNTDVESWSPNGGVLAFHHHGSTGADLFSIPLDAADPTPQPFLATEFAEEMTQFSPDGRFVAYLSDRTGERQVYIRPYPGPGAAVTVSIDGGVEPLWGRNGELFYRHPATNAMMVVVVSTTHADSRCPRTPLRWAGVCRLWARSFAGFLL